MKGIVFTEFLEMVEDKFGFDVADKIVSEASLPSGGIYTAVGTYDHTEMVSLVVNLSHESQVPVPDLLKAFGEYLFGQFVLGYGHFFHGVNSAFDFMAKIEDYIHVEVRKLYPDAELPSFEIDRTDANKLILIYRSERGLADFAEGLILGCIRHFQENVQILRENLSSDNSMAKFTLQKEPM
ncbi:MAG: heme NO-binding domain-containing protein [Bacteroidia bacterium]